MPTRIFHRGSPQPGPEVTRVRYEDDSPVWFDRVDTNGSVDWVSGGPAGRRGSWYGWHELNEDAVLVDATHERVRA